MDESPDVKSARMSVSLVQDLSSATSIYKRTDVTVKHKSKVLENAGLSTAARIRELRKAAGMTQAELGRSLGVTQVAVSNWEKGADVPKAQILAKLAELTGDNGSRANFLIEAGFATALPAPYLATGGPRDVILLKDPVAAGTPRAIEEKSIAAVLQLPREWFPPGGELYALRVTGDSMAPIVNSGFTVIVDTARRDPKKLIDRMVAARDGDGVTIKWLRKDGETFLLVPHHTSTAHPVRILRLNDGWAIVGEVIKWIGQPTPPRRGK